FNRSSTAFLVLPVMRPFDTRASRPLPLAAIASSAAPSSESNSKTSRPPCAQTCAIPRPIVPAPNTATTKSARERSNATRLLPFEFRFSFFQKGTHAFFLITRGKLQLECLALQHQRGL